MMAVKEKYYFFWGVLICLICKIVSAYVDKDFVMAVKEKYYICLICKIVSAYADKDFVMAVKEICFFFLMGPYLPYLQNCKWLICR